MSETATHATLDDFAQSDDVEPADAEKTYTARSVRERYSGETVGTAPRNWVASMIRKFPNAVRAFKTNEETYDDALRTAARQREIREAAEENDAPGMPVDAEELAEELDEHDFYDCRVRLGADELVDGEQRITVRGALRNYELRVDVEQVAWTA